MVKHWKNAAELPGLLSTSLSKTIKLFPAVGWIRGNTAANQEVLSEINDLRKENAGLKATLGKVVRHPAALEGLAGLDEEIEAFGECKYYRSPWQQETWQVKTTWREIFGIISPYLLQYPNHFAVKTVLRDGLFAKWSREQSHINPDLDDQFFQTVTIQLKALGLVETEYSQSTQGRMGFFWSLTPPGDRLMMQVRSVRTRTAAKS